MSDTQQILAALLANHVSGTPAPAQALRDLIVSVFGGYAQIHCIDAAVAQSLGTTPAKLTGFAADGPASGVTPAHGTDQITIGCAGVYLIGFNGTFFGDAATYTIRLRKNAVAEGTLACGVTLTGGSAQAPASFGGLVALSANDILTVYGEADSNGKNLTPKHMQLFARRVS